MQGSERVITGSELDLLGIQNYLCLNLADRTKALLVSAGVICVVEIPAFATLVDCRHS